jgi:hypothetical protein
MSLWPQRASVMILATTIAFGGLAPVAAVQAGISAPQRDASGIELVTEITQGRPTSEQQAQAFDDAMQFAIAHPKDVGYPWIDPASNTLELSAATDTGTTLLSAVQDAVLGPHRIRDVSFSYAQLEEIKHEVTTLAVAGVTDAELIYETAPDHLNNRVIITVSRLSEDLLKELAARYGTEAIAVRIDPDNLMAGSASRQTDVSPFYGGARINIPGGGWCSDGFPWYILGTTYQMLTAGHCVPNGGSVSTPSSAMGLVTSSQEENWSTTYGTQYFTGQSVYRGDLALIRISFPMRSDPFIYRGSATSGTYSTVKSMWSRSPVVGDSFYTGGARTGELSAWTVTVVHMDKWYVADGLNVWARNITEGSRSGTCIDHGDSGGSVFTLTTGGVAAKGIISGMGWLGCYVYFTDIREADYGLPGQLRTG